jgi:hypothetical protein
MRDGSIEPAYQWRLYLSEGVLKVSQQDERLTGGVLEIKLPLVVDRFVAEINGFLERKKGICEDPQH